MNTNILKRQNPITATLIHIGFWMFLYLTPLIFSPHESNHMSGYIIHAWPPTLLAAVLFYINYLVLIERLFLKKKLLLFILINITLIIICGLISERMRHNMMEDMPHPMPPQSEMMKGPRSFWFPHFDFFMILPVFASIGIKTFQKWTRMEKEKIESDRFRLESELKNMKYQLQPHFFFNVLNNIYALIDVSPDKAKETVHSLGKLMRYLLYETETQKVRLGQEIDFIVKYVNLMELRLSDSTKVRMSFPEINHDIEIAPLLYITLIENAFKHGVSGTKDSIIFIEMKVEDNVVHFLTENQYFPKTESDKSKSGIGLENLKRRLELIYPGRYTFTQKLEEEVYRSLLIIDLNEKEK